MSEKEEIELLKKELARTKLVLSTLVSWLQVELGKSNVIELINQLSEPINESESETE